jgi:5'-nucleotidase
LEVELVILLTNDDGIKAQGLLALKKELAKIGEVWVIAPEGEQSAVSHSLTLQKPLELKKIGERFYSLSGTPTDAVMLGYYGILKKKPTLVISGINHGPNMGDDVTYSGTVAGAIEGTLLGIPSIAVSMANPNFFHFDSGAKFVRKLALFVLKNDLPQNTFLNVNLPPKRGRIEKYKITRLDRKKSKKVELKRVDSRGKTFFWIGKENSHWGNEDGTDYQVVKKGFVSITPLQLDTTNYKVIEEICKWRFL